MAECDFLTIFDALPDLCLVLRPNDPIYTIAAANSAARLALTREGEIVGRNLFEILPDESGSGWHRFGGFWRKKQAIPCLPAACAAP